MKKMNITENLLRNMTTREEGAVAMFSGFSSTFETSNVLDHQLYNAQANTAILIKFSVSWECHQVVANRNYGEAKLAMARHLKNDMYRDILNELYGIHKMVINQPYHNQDLLESVQSLIDELR